MTQPAAKRRYAKKTLRHVGFDLNRNTEPDLVEWVDSIPNKAAYFKRLIREDIARRGDSEGNPLGFPRETLEAIDDAVEGRTFGPYDNLDDMLDSM